MSRRECVSMRPFSLARIRPIAPLGVPSNALRAYRFPHALLAACQTHRRMRCWALACRALCGSARGCVGAVSFSRPDGGIAARQSATWAPAIAVLCALALCL